MLKPFVWKSIPSKIFPFVPLRPPYLSPQIYVRYRTGLCDAINEFEVRFEISRRRSVRTITSAEASSAEILFSFER